MDIYEITFLKWKTNKKQFSGRYTGKTFEWTEKKCQKYFGKNEWEEIKAGYLPHIVAVKIS